MGKDYADPENRKKGQTTYPFSCEYVIVSGEGVSTLGLPCTHKYDARNMNCSSGNVVKSSRIDIEESPERAQYASAGCKPCDQSHINS